MLSTRFTRLLPGPIPLGLGIAANLVGTAYKAYNAIRSNDSMPVKRSYGARRVAGRRRSVRRRMYPMAKMSLRSRHIVRSSGLSTMTATASNFTNLLANIQLNQVQTSDLQASWRLYRIKKAVVHLVPRVDTANSGLVNNWSFLVAACNDPEGSATPPANITTVTAYDNSYQKQIVSGDRFTYTFYPKAVNTIDIAGTATPAGSYSVNPWIQLNSVGITVPHRQLLLAAQASLATTLTFDIYYDIHFEVKGEA